jgi:hypothetical protein
LLRQFILIRGHQPIKISIKIVIVNVHIEVTIVDRGIKNENNSGEEPRVIQLG